MMPLKPRLWHLAIYAVALIAFIVFWLLVAQFYVLAMLLPLHDAKSHKFVAEISGILGAPVEFFARRARAIEGPGRN